MEIKEILSYVDNTLLLPSSNWSSIKEVLDDSIKYNVASSCIPPSFVKRAKEYVGINNKICTVIGFPLGYQLTEVKLLETRLAIKDGADEIDMVINIGDLKDKKFSDIESEISYIKEACYDKVLKVIIETCMLNDDEKIKMCNIVSNSGADFIKTSTGFGSNGATFEDIKLFKENVYNGVKIKAAGGINSMEDAIKFINLGANRLGTSKIIKIIKNEVANGY